MSSEPFYENQLILPSEVMPSRKKNTPSSPESDTLRQEKANPPSLTRRNQKANGLRDASIRGPPAAPGASFKACEAISQRKWVAFLQSLKLEEPLEFNEGDVGLAGRTSMDRDSFQVFAKRACLLHIGIYIYICIIFLYATPPWTLALFTTFRGW